MADGQGISVLRRKAEAGRTSVAATRQVTPCKALSTALIQALDRRLDLAVSVSGSAIRTGTLAELLETLPESGLLAVLEAPGEVQGLMAFDPDLLAALIEQMMVGRLAPRPAKPRRPTRTDAALCADLVDDVLRRFEAALDGQPGAHWSAGYGYASYLDDPRPLGLMMEDVDYRQLTLRGELGGAGRSFRLMLALPVSGRPASTSDWGKAPRGAAGPPGDVDGPDEQDPADGWTARMERCVMDSDARVTAVLHTMSLSLATLEGLQPGQQLSIPRAALDATRLLGSDGSVLARGRLGQSGGRRAVRLPGPASEGHGAGSFPATGGQSQAPRPASAPSPDAPSPETEANAAQGVRKAAKPDRPSREPPATGALPEAAAPEAFPSLPGLPDLPDLPDLSDLPEPDALPDLPGLADLPEPGALADEHEGGFPSLGDLPKL